MRSFLLAAVLAPILVVAACGDDSSSGNSQSAIPPSNCTEPCAVGTTCFGPAEPACNGTWYCQTDQKWACSPLDSGGPGGFPDGTLGDDGGDDSSGGSDGASDAPGETSKSGKDASKD